MWVPPQHVFYKDVFQPLGADLEKATGGRVKFSFLAKAVAAPQGTADAMRDGLADISLIIHGFTPARFPLTKLAEIALLSDSSETLSVAYHRVYEKHFTSANEHKGLKVLAMFTLTPTQIMTKSKPVRSLADLRGTKLRVAGGISADVAGALGSADRDLLEAIRTTSADVERAWLAEAKARGADGAKALADLREEIRRAAR